jgi:hypothetical protein
MFGILLFLLCFPRAMKSGEGKKKELSLSLFKPSLCSEPSPPSPPHLTPLPQEFLSQIQYLPSQFLWHFPGLMVNVFTILPAIIKERFE